MAVNTDVAAPASTDLSFMPRLRLCRNAMSSGSRCRPSSVMMPPGWSAFAWTPRAPRRRSSPTAKSTLAVFDCPYASHFWYGRRSNWMSSKTTGEMWCPRELRHTTRLGAPRRRAGASRDVVRKWPRWFEPNWSSKPSAVFAGGDAITPALFTRMCSTGCVDRNRSAKRRMSRSDPSSNVSTSTC